MADNTSLTESTYIKLVEQLEALADDSRVMGQFDETRAYEEAIEAIRAWLDGVADRPDAVLEQYGYLVTKAPSEDKLSTAESGHPEIEPLVDAPEEELESQSVMMSAPAGMDGSVPETEEVRTDAAARHELAMAESYLEQGLEGDANALRQAVALSGMLQEQPHISGEVQDLHARAQNELNRRLQEALDAGDEARQEEDGAAARDHYQTALAYDPENTQARMALHRLDQSAAADLDESEIASLRRGLKERKDLTALGDAVYKATFLDAENKLTPELTKLLIEARKAYDETRVQQGAETTMMRFGDLVARQEARDQIAERVSGGERVIFDLTTNTMRPAHEVLEEANELYRRHSEDTAQHEIGRVKQALPAYPRGALQRLTVALDKPFHEEQQRTLREQKDAIEQLIEDEERAEALLRKADEAEEPVEKLSLILQAHDVFPYLAGLAEKLRQTRQTSAELLAARMGGLHTDAATLAGRREFEAARDQIALADAIPATWPEKEKPELLLSLIEAGNDLRESIKQQELLLYEFDEQAERIRQHVANPSKRQAGLALLAQLDADGRFASLPEYKELRAEMDQYRDIGDQLVEARKAHGRGEWQRVFDLAEAILGSGKVGQFENEVNALHREADIELKISAVRRKVRELDLPEADEVLEQLIRDNPERKELLQERLKDELAQIDLARDAEDMKKLFQRAERLIAGKKPTEKRQFEALRIYRFVGGDPSEKRPDWPDFTISFYTSAARSAAATLRQTLRDKLIPDLQEAFRQHDGAVAAIDENRMPILADRAKQLRDAHLLDDEAEREAARWLILRQERRDAEARQESGDWEGAVEIWQELDEHYPRFVDRELRHARIQYYLDQADRLMRAEKNEQAVELLLKAQNERGLTQAWELLLKLAEAHARRGEFNKALDDTARAARLPDEQAQREAEKKREHLLREREIYETLQKARQEVQSGDQKEALRILQGGLQSSIVADSERLLHERDQLFDQMVADLRRQADERQKGGTVEDKVEAVVALVDIRELEDLVGIPAAERRSDEELEPLRDELQPGAESVMESAQEFHAEQQPLEEGIRRAAELVGRLQTFSRVLPLIGSDLGRLPDDLALTQKELGETLDRLKEVRVILQEASEPERWRTALLTDFFGDLEQYRQRVRRLSLNKLIEVEEFETRLDEWRAAHSYLLDKVIAIRQAFVQDEDFAFVQRALREIAVRPDVRPDTNTRWQRFQQKEYEDIRQLMQHKLIVRDAYAGTLHGWDAVDELATERKAQLEAWQAWKEACERLIDKTWTAREIALGNGESATRVKVRADWQMVIERATEALALLEAGPTVDDEPVPIHSRSARAIQDEGRKREALVRETLLEAHRNQPDHRLFPSPQDFANAARSIPLLERVIKEARSIGPSNEEERRRLAHYEKVLSDLREKKRRSRGGWWRRVLGD